MNTLNVALSQGSSRKAESTWQPRCSALQKEAIQRALAGKTLPFEELSEYVATGDLARVSADTHHLLTTTVTQARAGLTASQAKRIWPRKVAAVALMA